jgi:equilibrative nucleoside transporter 1/2/3
MFTSRGAKESEDRRGRWGHSAAAGRRSGAHLLIPPSMRIAPSPGPLQHADSGRDSRRHSRSDSGSSESGGLHGDVQSHQHRDGEVEAAARYYWLFVLQGVGQLVPWNAIITASSYYSRRLCSTAFASNFESTFGFVYSAFGVLGLVLTLRKPASNPFIARRLARQGLLLAVLVFAGFSCLVLNVSLSGNAVYALSLILVALAAVTVAVSQSGMFALAGSMSDSSSALQGLMLGQGIAGLAVAIVRLVTSAVGPDLTPCLTTHFLPEPSMQACQRYSIDRGSLAYFLTSTTALLICSIYIPPIVEHVPLRKPSLLFTDTQLEEITSPLVASHEAAVTKRHWDEHVEIEEELGCGQYDRVDSNDARAALSGVTPEALSVCLVFVVTLSVFPSLTSLIVSKDRCEEGAPRWTGDLFGELFFLLFNIGDLLGRIVTGKFPVTSWLSRHSRSALPKLSLSRVVFIPLFLLCRVQGSLFPTIFASDFFPVIFVACLGLTNGWVSTVSMMAGPLQVEMRLREAAGVAMIFFLSVGLMLGSFASYGVLWIARGTLSQ